MSTFAVFAICAFASSFSLRLIDPLVLPIAHFFAIAPSLAVMLSPAYSVPYALAQPFLGPLGDRFGRALCIKVCMTGMGLVLLLGSFAPSFELLFASRVAAGVFGGGLVPLVLAALGDAYDMSNRQVMIGRMLFALIGGQMLGSVVAGLVNEVLGWRGPLGIAAALALGAAALAWWALPSRPHAAAPGAAAAGRASFRTLYGRVFQNPKAPWLFGAVFVEGILFFGLFPYVGEVLVGRGFAAQGVSLQVGLILGAFGIGGL
ncbi:MAG: MFS transporter, partial [Rhizobacter sp.]